MVKNEEDNFLDQLCSCFEYKVLFKRSLLHEFQLMIVTEFIWQNTELKTQFGAVALSFYSLLHENRQIMCSFALRKVKGISQFKGVITELEKAARKRRAGILQRTEDAQIRANNMGLAKAEKSLCEQLKGHSGGIQELSGKLEPDAGRCLVEIIGEIQKKQDVIALQEARSNLLQALEVALTPPTETQEEPEEPPLKLVDAPYLPPLESEVYTLVLDLDETLVHYFETETEGHVLVRPGAEDFLKEMSQIFEVVIFTAALQDYADWVLDQIDPEGCVKYRLYRQHAIPTEAFFIKDLSRLGRDLSHAIIVDNLAENFQRQPENGIMIKTWLDDPDDTALFELGPILKTIVERKADVREALGKFSSQMAQQNSEGVDNFNLYLD